jgi:hypothetical protein
MDAGTRSKLRLTVVLMMLSAAIVAWGIVRPYLLPEPRPSTLTRP